MNPWICRSVLAALLTVSGTVAAAEAGPSQDGPALQRTAPPDAPNIVVVLLDDVGFGAAASFGGPVATPTLDQLGSEGLRFNRFHTTSICSPTRASLLTGRNPHVTGIGAVMNASDDRPGYSGFHSKDTATIAEILRQNGYSTAAFGKWHQTPDWEMSRSGPFDRWPTGEGFETFYGFQGGETDQFEPTLYQGTTPVLRPPGPGYHLTEDLADQAITWIRTEQAVTPDKPFFVYFAPGGIHAPIQVPQQWIEPYRGKFDGGWDALREAVFARQKALGVIPPDTALTPRPKGLPAWDSLDPAQRKVAAALMEAYAGFLAHTDAQVGRLVEALKQSGLFDNTLFVYIVGDNGASAEGGLEGSLNYFGKMQGIPETTEQMLARLDEIGGPETYAHINSAWAWATDAPFQWTKTVASHLGGTRNPMVITWPEQIKDKGGLRSQFSHVNDIVPTLLEAAGIPAPGEVNGIAQKPMDGTSLLYTFDDPDSPERHTTQYFEVFGNRAIYHEGWMASAFHGRLPWNVISRGDTPFDEDRWELYDLRNDFSQAHDLADQEPEKLQQLQALFMEQAAANQVLPLAGQPIGSTGLPDLAAGLTRATYPQGAIVPEDAIPHTYNRSWALLAEVEITGSNSSGVIAALGGSSAGWSLYLDRQQRPVFRYRVFDLKTIEITGPPLPVGPASIAVEFDYDGKGWGRGGRFTLSVDGEQVGADVVPATPPALYSIDETFAVGIDTGSPAGAYPADAIPGYALSDARVSAVTVMLR